MHKDIKNPEYNIQLNDTVVRTLQSCSNYAPPPTPEVIQICFSFEVKLVSCDSFCSHPPYHLGHLQSSQYLTVLVVLSLISFFSPLDRSVNYLSDCELQLLHLIFLFRSTLCIGT